MRRCVWLFTAVTLLHELAAQDPPRKTSPTTEAERLLAEADEKFDRKLWLQAGDLYQRVLQKHASLGPVKARLEEIRSRLRQCAEQAQKDEWVRVETEHYYIEVQRFTLPQHTAEKLMAELKQYLELIFAEYARMFDFKGPLQRRAQVTIYKNRAEYLADKHPEGAAAYYDPNTQRIVGYFPADEAAGTRIIAADKRKYLLNVLAHECCHQFFDLAFPKFYAHEKSLPWLSEGLADCFGASEIRNGRIVILMTQTEIARSQLQTIKKAVEEKRHVKLSRFVTLTHKEFMANAELHYAQAWSFCHFLLCFGSPTPGNGMYRSVISKLVQELKNGTPPDRAMSAAFRISGKPIDWEHLEAQYVAFVKKLY